MTWEGSAAMKASSKCDHTQFWLAFSLLTSFFLRVRLGSVFFLIDSNKVHITVRTGPVLNRKNWPVNRETELLQYSVSFLWLTDLTRRLVGTGSRVNQDNWPVLPITMDFSTQFLGPGPEDPCEDVVINVVITILNSLPFREMPWHCTHMLSLPSC